VSRGELCPTASQTIGPFLSIGVRPLERPEVVQAGTQGAFVLRGRVLDGAGSGVGEGVVELWQAAPDGSFDASTQADGSASWFGRSLTDAEGRFHFVTMKPGARRGPGGAEAPHLELLVFGRGLLRPVRTRAYFPDEEAANAADPVLSRVPAQRRATLVAHPEGDELVFDVRLQGVGETVFFA